MEKTRTAITRYKICEWFVDIIEDPDTYEAWLTHKGNGISTLMFGAPKKYPGKIEGTDTQEFEDFCDLVEANCVEYMRDYLAEHMGVFISHED